MPRFTLNVRDGDAVMRDSHVYHFPTAQDARDATIRLVRQLIVERERDFDGKQIEIADATGHPVAVVSLYDVMPERMN